jgi:AmiR/NasT family two-component response regulator
VRPLRVLLAEDESIIRLGLRRILEEAGHQVVAAPDGRTAVKLARQTRPDLALLDIKMPGLDGLEAAREIYLQRPLPIVLLTAYGDQELVERAAGLPILAYLIKPVNERELLATLEVAREIYLQRPLPIVLLTAYGDQELVERAAGLPILAYLIKPVNEQELLATLEVVTARFEEQQWLVQQATELEEQLEARKVVERAKGVLMERESLSEKEAYLRIQRQARQERRTMRQVAEAILGE